MQNEQEVDDTVEEDLNSEKVFEENLSGRAKRAYEVWKRYYGMSVWKNPHLCSRTFLYVCGVYLTHKGLRYQSHGELYAPRINPLFVQRSGSGKSQAMKASHQMLTFLGCQGSYITKTTDAALIGTMIEGRKGTPAIPKYGLLKNYDYLVWDEGSVLLKTGPYSENLPDIIQMTTDDPGYVCKPLRLGEIKFKTNTAVCAGTYMDGSITTTIFKRGMFQRMLLVHHKVTQDEINDYIRNETSLIKATAENKLEIKKQFQEILNEIKFELFTKVIEKVEIEEPLVIVDDEGEEKTSTQMVRKIIDEEHPIMNIDGDAQQKLNMNMVMPFSTEAGKSYKVGDFRLDIIQSFVSRRNQIRQVAAILSGINEMPVIPEENLLVGYLQWREHVRAANALLLMTTTIVKTDMNADRIELILEILRPEPIGLPIGDLVEKVIRHPKWDTGKSNVRRIISDLVDVKILLSKKQHGNRIITIGDKVAE